MTGASAAHAAAPKTPRIVRTDTLAPLAGRLYTPAKGQSSLAFYGTDLGLTFEHQGKIRILFGDTFTTATNDPFPNDDAQGTIPFGLCPGGDLVDAWVAAHPPASGGLSWQRGGPPVVFATDPTTANTLSFIHVFENGTSLEMGPLKTPVAAFSDGHDNAFGLFYRVTSDECQASTSGAPTCDAGLVCDPGIGNCGPLPVPCVVAAAPGARGSCPLGLTCLPTANGACRDTTSSIDDGGDEGRVRSVAQRMEIGVADPSRPEYYTGVPWNVNKFVNPVARTVRHLDLTNRDCHEADYRAADGTDPSHQKVLVWGRPAFAGVQAEVREADVYLLYADMPSLDTTGAPIWNPHYFTGVSKKGVPVFSSNQRDAVPLDLSGGNGDPSEPIDIVNQLTVSWVAPIQKWVMLYGGDLEPLIIPVFDPGAQPIPGGGIQIRFADNPWGPWTPPQTLLAAGDPTNPVGPPTTQYGPGGILFDPLCTSSDCVTGDLPPLPGGFDIGRLYAPNIVDCWTEDRGHNQADIYWNVATWDPYEVVLMKTRLAR
jgi:hypothetical protein